MHKFCGQFEVNVRTYLTHGTVAKQPSAARGLSCSCMKTPLLCVCLCTYTHVCCSDNGICSHGTGGRTLCLPVQGDDDARGVCGPLDAEGVRVARRPEEDHREGHGEAGGPGTWIPGPPGLAQVRGRLGAQVRGQLGTRTPGSPGVAQVRGRTLVWSRCGWGIQGQRASLCDPRKKSFLPPAPARDPQGRLRDLVRGRRGRGGPGAAWVTL